MTTVSARPAARVVCLDSDGRVLLMHWHDKVSGMDVWEPPGGGIDPGETPLEAARRELEEETGLPGSAVVDRWVEVDRDFPWLGVRYVHTERYYLARFPTARPQVRPGALTPEESEAFLGFQWAEQLPGDVQPPELAQVMIDLSRSA